MDSFDKEGKAHADDDQGYGDAYGGGVSADALMGQSFSGPPDSQPDELSQLGSQPPEIESLLSKGFGFVTLHDLDDVAAHRFAACNTLAPDARSHPLMTTRSV